MLWNGSELTTVYVNSSTLRAEVPADNLAAASQVTVVVTNPEPAGGQSNPARFTISRPGNLFLSVMIR